MEMLGQNPEDIIKANKAVQDTLRICRNKPPSRQEALNIAYQIENSAGEAHFQMFMEKQAETKIEEIFQRLNNDDQDHAVRILRYMDEQGIELRPVAI